MGQSTGERHLLPKDPEQWVPPERCEPEGSLAAPFDARGACWKNRVLPPLDLRGANLCRADLRGTDLSACLMEGCELTLARYDHRTLVPEGFDLRKSGAAGPEATLNGAFFNGADLRGMDLRNANFMGAYLSGCDLSGSVLDGARLVGADLRFAKLQGCHCVGTRFGGSQLNQADFRAAELKEATLDTAESIDGADFSFTTGISAEQLASLMARPHYELDCWNPITRKTSRASIEQLLRDAKDE